MGGLPKRRCLGGKILGQFAKFVTCERENGGFAPHHWVPCAVPTWNSDCSLSRMGAADQMVGGMWIGPNTSLRRGPRREVPAGLGTENGLVERPQKASS
jgi:hypothetical protein